jgi:hypothetical protein
MLKNRLERGRERTIVYLLVSFGERGAGKEQKGSRRT